MGVLPAGDIGAIPTSFWVVAGVVGFVLVLVAVGVALSPRSRRQLRFLADRTGIGWGIGAVLVLAATVSFGSVFALGGTTTGRYDYVLAFAFLLHAAGLFLLGDAAGSLTGYLAVRRTPRRDAAEVAPGERVAVDGEAVAVDRTLETPFADEPALCYEARVMERHGDGGNAVSAESRGVGGNWRPEHRAEAGVAFDVEDATGRVRVVPDGADLRLAETAEVSVATDDDLPERVRAFVTSPEVGVGFGAHDRRYVEAALRPGDRVAVVGPAVQNGAGGADGSTFVDAREGECLVADRDVDGLRARLGRRVARSTLGGAATAVLGYVAMLTVSGAA